MPRKVIVDTDISVGYRFRDVDDALALVHLFAHTEKVEVLGITTVFGNTSVKCTYEKAKEVLGVLGREDVPVRAGADSPLDLGKETGASRFIVETVRAHPGEVTLLTIGPTTNVATALMKAPDLAESLKEVILVGGSIVGDRRFVAPVPLELNFFLAPSAARTILESGARATLIQDRLCREVVFGEAELRALESSGSLVAEHLAPSVRDWWKLNRRIPFLPWKGGFVAWDVLGSAMLLDEGFFGGFEKDVLTVKSGVWGRGRVFRLPDGAGRAVRYPTSVDSKALLGSLIEAIISPRDGSRRPRQSSPALW